MKFLGSEIAYLISEREMRGNIRALLRYLLLLAAVITTHSVLFHLIMTGLEGQRHSWVTGFYWTMVVMTTLGFGDITFTTDVGRAFSVVVLLSGVVLLLVLLPFLFIRLFYAPWFEARVRLRAPRRVPAGTAGHVLIAEFDDVASGLAARLASERVPHFVIEPDVVRAGQLVNDGVPVVAGRNDSRATYEQLGIERASLVLANCTDTVNTNITLTVREAAPRVPIVAIVEAEDSADILRLAGATHVLPLKHQLGEYLANRVEAGAAEAHVIGAFGDLLIAELPARGTPFAGSSVRDTRLRERTGLNLVGLWERGRLLPAYPQTLIRPDSVVVVAGTAGHIAALGRLLPASGAEPRPVIVIGAGTVGRAAALALKRKGLQVHVIERDEAALALLAGTVDRAFQGDAADRALLDRAGIGSARSVLLTTNDDAMNIFLAVYCRRLQPEIRIVSRITHERNLEAIHRAGADFVLSYTSLGVDAVLAILRGHELVLLGEGVELFSIPVPASLAGLPLRESQIGSRTGLSVVALKHGDGSSTPLDADAVLRADARLVMLGSLEQRRAFADAFERRPGQP
ncbi:MAG TPA: NAD-binding protein [Vicinamibacterales bacterium]|nr:NAD-binding protein [Vicinamibacterales bacterium]HPW21866.1 NAD-binding protein [Vicinamibacterales bacterium]